MSSRDKILTALKAHQFDGEGLPDVDLLASDRSGAFEKYSTVLSGIGGKAYAINSLQDIEAIIAERFSDVSRVINLVSGINVAGQETAVSERDHSTLHNVGLAIIKGRFAIEENGAVWITEDDYHPRALPFICEHLVVVIPSGVIVQTMHDAYRYAEQWSYGYSCFIAGPSKTADIEQSLVIGAHGPKSMSVFIQS